MSGPDPGPPPGPGEGRPTVPDWMGGVGIGQLQVLSLESTVADKRLSPFVVGRSLKQEVGEIESANTEAGGLRYVLRVRDAAKVEKLLGLQTLFDGTTVKVQLHPTLNTRKCVISCREIQHESEEEILKELAQDGVIAVRRITRLDNEKRVNTPTLVLTVNGTVVPEHIHIGPLRIKTRIYVPDPMVCYQCYAFGHTKQRCKSQPRCRNCSGSHEPTPVCSAEAFCFHCKAKHSPANRQCPKYQTEKDILKVMHTKVVSYQEAMKQVAAGGGSYAKVTALQQRLEDARNETTEAELKKKDDLIRQLSETIALLSKRVEELEEKKKQKKERRNKNKQQQTPPNAEGTTSAQDEEMEFETGSELEVEQESATATTTTATAVAAVTAAALAAVSQVNSRTGTIPKAGAPNTSDSGSKVSDQSKQNPSNFKRQHTLSDFNHPNKKTPAPNHLTQKQQLPPRSQNKK